MLRSSFTSVHCTRGEFRRCRRSLFGFSFKKTPKIEPITPTPIVLTQDNLFHPLSTSPIASLRQRAENIKRIGKSPTGKSINYDCPKSGWPTHHSLEEYQADTKHDNFVPILRQTNEDEHDLRSGRALDEFVFPGRQDVEEGINMTSWDSFLYTRHFNAVNSERSIRHVSKLLTYPMTVASVLHQGSPYRKRLTKEGLRSISALRATLHPPVSAGATSENLLAEGRPFRIFVLGARAESTLPGDVWIQGLPYIFPDISFHIHFIGPEATVPKGRNVIRTVDGGLTEYYHPRLTFTTHQSLYHTLHESQTFAPFDPYLDVFFLPCPGLGHPMTKGQWASTMPAILESKCGIFVTGYSEEDMKRDIRFIAETCKNEHDLLLRPGKNDFASRKWDVSDLDPRDVIQNNWGVFGVRGKLYETVAYGSSPTEELSV